MNKTSKHKYNKYKFVEYGNMKILKDDIKIFDVSNLYPTIMKENSSVFYLTVKEVVKVINH